MPTRTVTAGARRLSTEKQVLMRDRALEIRDTNRGEFALTALECVNMSLFDEISSPSPFAMRKQLPRRRGSPSRKRNVRSTSTDRSVRRLSHALYLGRTVDVSGE